MQSAPEPHNVVGPREVDVAELLQASGVKSCHPCRVVCVQNFYNIAHRADGVLIHSLAAQGIAYVPYFPLGGFSPPQSNILSMVATRRGATPLAAALSWLLQRSANILLIAGTSSVGHLVDNVAGAALALSASDLSELDSIID